MSVEKVWESVLGCGEGKERCGKSGGVGKCDRVWGGVGKCVGVWGEVCWGVGKSVGEVLGEV